MRHERDRSWPSVHLTSVICFLPESIEANDVNGSGAVAATAEDGTATVVDGEEVTELPDLAAGPSKAETIAESGEVAGSSRDASGNCHAVIWTGC